MTKIKEEIEAINNAVSELYNVTAILQTDVASKAFHAEVMAINVRVEKIFEMIYNVCINNAPLTKEKRVTLCRELPATCGTLCGIFTRHHESPPKMKLSIWESVSLMCTLLISGNSTPSFRLSISEKESLRVVTNRFMMLQYRLWRAD